MTGFDPTRDETELQRLDRNWSDLLQELRVALAGSQILTGLLLTLPFQARFGELDAGQSALYLAVLGTMIVATLLGLAPVSAHRLLFRRGVKQRLVLLTHVLLRIALALTGAALAGTAAFIFWVVVGGTAGIAAGAITAVLALATWLAIPWLSRR